MSRIARIALTGIPYHITQRGNGRQQIFFDEADYLLYLDLLRDNAVRASLSVWAYCLMPNHIHLIAAPRKDGAMARALGRTHADFARHFNLRKRTCGHVWQARYYSCPLGGAHLWLAMAYVERNPVRAGIVASAEEYRWSSAAAHCGLAGSGALLDVAEWSREFDAVRWREVLRASVAEEELSQRIQEASRRGRPLGEAEFVGQLESRSGRRLRPLAPGKPKSLSAGV